MNKRTEQKMLRDLALEREKWLHFFEILCRPYVWISLVIALMIFDHFVQLDKVGISLFKNFTGMK